MFSTNARDGSTDEEALSNAETDLAHIEDSFLSASGRFEYPSESVITHRLGRTLNHVIKVTCKSHASHTLPRNPGKID